MLKITEATGVRDINEVIQKFATQGETQKNLLELKQTNEKKLLVLTDKRQTVKGDLEKMKLEGLEAMTRKQVDDMEIKVQRVQHKHSSIKETYDESNRMLVDLQAGIDHLCGKLNEIKLEENAKDVVIDSSHPTKLVDALDQARQKLKIIYNSMKNEDAALFQEAIDHVHRGGLGGNQAKLLKQGPQGNFFARPNQQAKGTTGAQVSQNVRVRLPEKDDDSDMSDVDPEAELAEDLMERMKIKH